MEGYCSFCCFWAFWLWRFGFGGDGMDKVSVLFVALIVNLVIFLIYRRDQEFTKRLSSVTERVKGLEEQNEKLKQANRKRMPYESYEHILDAMAALDAEEREIEIKRIFIENARSHMTQAVSVGTKRE